MFTSKWASRHNGLHFLNISTSKSGPNLRSLISPDGFAPAALASLLFDPPEPQNIGTNTVFRDISTFFAHLDLLSYAFLFSDLLSYVLFSDSSHLCFSICPYCRKFHF